MRKVFTVTVGRSGSDFIVGAVNQYALNAFAEHEPPALLLQRLGQRRFFRERNLLQPTAPLASLGRGLQRRFLFTDAMLGRGPAFDWMEDGDWDSLRGVAARKVRRIRRFERRGWDVYLESSHYFIRTQAEVLHEQFPDLELLKLTRDPLRTARSLANRPAAPFLTGPPPDRRQNIFRIADWQGRLSLFQIYLHRWLETELRFHRFVEQRGIAHVCHVRTEHLQDPAELQRIFETFGIRHRPFGTIRKSNTNRAGRNPDTRVGEGELAEYRQLLALLPDELRRRIAYLDGYEPSLDAPPAAAAAAS